MRCLVSLWFCLFLPTTPAVAQVAADAAFMERTALAAADSRCMLLSNEERLALESGRLQARNALLRGGVDADDLAFAEAQTRQFASDRPCDDPDLAQSIARLKDAFSAFANTMSMDYETEAALWRASRSRWDTWRVVQSLETGPWRAEAGIPASDQAEADEQVSTVFAIALALPPETPAPVSARLYLRDPNRSDQAWIGGLFSTDPTPPPRPITQAFWASDRQVRSGEDGNPETVIFLFPTESIDRLRAMDPREIFEVDIQPRRPDNTTRPLTFQIAVGDFAAAVAFASLPVI